MQVAIHARSFPQTVAITFLETSSDNLEIAALKARCAEILKTSIDDVAGRAAAMRLGPPCFHCHTTGSCSYPPTLCPRCAGHGAQQPTTLAHWRFAAHQAKLAAADGWLGIHLAYLTARSATAQAVDTILLAWRNTGIPSRLNLNLAYEWEHRRAGGHPTTHEMDQHHRLAVINAEMQDAYRRVSNAARAAQVTDHWADRQRRTLALAKTLADALASIEAATAKITKTGTSL